MGITDFLQHKLLLWIDRYLVLLLLVIFCLRTGFLFSSDIGLVGDESYYWEWSRRPDWCYFSKPPMVAWLIAAFTQLFGNDAGVVRLPVVVCGTVFLWYFHATAQAFYGRRAAAFALLLVLATPDNVIANLFMTIDPPLNCFWMMSVYYLRGALFEQKPACWFWAGCATALGLLSKQVAIVLPLMLLVFLLTDSRRRVWLQREFWLYLLPVLAAGIPILLWNQQHEWVMFTHSKTHFTSQISSSLVMSFTYFGELVLFQGLLISPLIFGLVMLSSWQLLKRFKTLQPEQQFLLLMGPVLLFGILLLSIKQKVQGNWPMPFYFTGFILLSGQWAVGSWQRWSSYALKLGFAMVLTTYLLPTALKLFNLENTSLDPIKRFKHWPELVAEIQAERVSVIPDLPHSFVVALGHRNIASQLAFYLPDHPQVFRYEANGVIKSQYEIWPGPVEFTGADALVVSDASSVAEPVRAAFGKFTYLTEIVNPMQKNAKFYLFLAERLTHWPVAGATLPAGEPE